MSPSGAEDIPWSELALVLAVRRAGTIRAAAKALRVSHPTVSRRIAELQELLGVQVFERDGRRLRLTVAGEDLAETAERIEAEVHGLGRRIVGRDHRLEGVVRVAVSPSMMAALAPALPTFAERHPGIVIELVTGLSFAHLTRREADVAIRQTNQPHETLVGRRVGLFEQRAYVATSLARRLEAEGLRDPRAWPWIDWDEAHAHHASARWVSENIDDENVVVRCDSSIAMFQLLVAGVGVAYAPTMLAGRHADVRRLEVSAFPAFHRAIWVLTHADLRGVGRVRAVVEWLHEVLHVEGGGVWPGVG